MPIHQVEVDQSGKIEDTRNATVVAFSDGIHGAVLIPTRVKRECIAILRATGKARPTILAHLFATVLYLLLRDHVQDMALVVIDVEYVGHNREIKQHLLNLLRRGGHPVSADQISFRHIGKKSPAHRLAIETLRGKRAPDRRVTLEELLAEA
ncbi:MAG: hypothetical protein A2Z04_06900 [Chloroflexi bacterium RBG_16_57_9]|nr:MAG: hypothetical protein A2Z04_06900 [Chloroflexi bacterium RBG_16_57_9]